MITTEKIEYVDGLLERVVTQLPTDTLRGVPKRILTIEQGVDLLGGMVTRRRRSVVPGHRLLTPDITTQPGLGIKVGKEFISFAYGEDVLDHPLSKSIIRALESFGNTGE